jgi:gentisate 1,2-dioxygenase
MSSSTASNVTRLPNRDTALKALYADVAAKNMFPYWATTKEVANDEDRQLLAAPKAIPFLWSCESDIEPILARAVELVTMDDSERRSLVLMNPGLAPRRATVSTMYTAYRLNDANEIMPPHRHSPNAIRLGLKGKGNFTGVDGENIVFGPGDMVLTPNDTWHNHGTVGNEPALNLSVLDLPLVESLNAVHFEHDYKEMENGKLVSKKRQSERFSSDYSQRIYGYGGMMPRFASKQPRGAGTSSPMFVYRYDMMLELLHRHRENDGDVHDGLLVEYIDPTSGAPVFKTMTFFMQMLHPGQKTLPVKTTASLLVSPFEGEGYSLVDGQKFSWNKFDTLAVPAGSWFEHINTGKEPLILFVASDEPTLKKLSLYKKWGKSASGEVSQILD